MKNLLLLFFSLHLSVISIAQPDAQSTLKSVDKSFFIENKGQWPEEVLFLTRIGGLDAWITKIGV